MKRIADIRLQQTQGLDFESVEAEFETQLYKHPLTAAEEVEFLAEIAADNFDGPIHVKLYNLQDLATRIVARRESWETSPEYVETGLCLDVILYDDYSD